MANKRIGGLISFKVDGEIFNAKGSFTYNLGKPKKEMVVGSDSVHGYKELPQVAMIEGAITDTQDLDMEAFRDLRDVTVTLELANGKVIVIEEAVEASDGAVTTEEGEAEFKFEGTRGREVS
jgi:hypothetical protein